VINLDDKFLSQVLNKTNLKEFTYSLTDKNATLHAENIYQNAAGISFDLCLKNEALNISLAVGGEIIVLNALGAAAVGFGFGFTLAQLKKGLENFKAPSMRLESRFFNGALFINDAYNANPSSMQASIKTVCASYPTKKINLVLGDMFELGEDSLMYHKQIAEFINVCGINAVYLIGTQMRRIKGLINTKVFFADDHAALVDLLRAAQFSEGDIVLFKGSRGMKLEKAWEQIFSEN
ncbi:MAG: hypothetical protein LBC07_04405, partial [Elusimicrobiota bacterium]|nr:hypothetical protein [Elusimicrobiota bacterium]